jgi:hypothetical protein
MTSGRIRRLGGLFLSTQRKYREHLKLFSTDNTCTHTILSPPPSICICNGFLCCSSPHRSIPHPVLVLPLCLVMALERSHTQPFLEASKVKPCAPRRSPTSSRQRREHHGLPGVEVEAVTTPKVSLVASRRARRSSRTGSRARATADPPFTAA